MSKAGCPNILIATAQIPFTRGGAELLVEKLEAELTAHDCNVDTVRLPFSAQPNENLLNQIAKWRSLDLRVFNGQKVDLVIATKFPSYMIFHPNKVVWMVHQHRQIYELYGSRFGDFGGGLVDEALRQMVVKADMEALRECQEVFTISPNVADRLKRYLDVDATALHPPLPFAGRYRKGKKGNYILSVGRICSIKRIELIVQAMATIEGDFRLKIVGDPDEPNIYAYIQSEIEKHHLWDRIEFLGRVPEEELLSLYADAFAVYYAPFDEDYGFVSLEALSSGKPVVTASDSGGVLEFIQDGENGLVVGPTPEEMAGAFNRLSSDEVLYEKLSSSGPPEVAQQENWNHVVSSLTSSLLLERELPFSAAAMS